MPVETAGQYPAIVITVSDRSARGERPDTSGPQVAGLLHAQGFPVADIRVVADEREQIEEALRKAAEEAALVITTGGTGLGPRDVTPEATASVIERRVPGLAEAMRSAGAQNNTRAWLSRGIAGLRGRSLIVNLPGSPVGATTSLSIILALLPHALSIARGGGHEEGK